MFYDIGAGIPLFYGKISMAEAGILAKTPEVLYIRSVFGRQKPGVRNRGFSGLFF